MLRPSVFYIQKAVVNRHNEPVRSKDERKGRGAYRAFPCREQVVVVSEFDYVTTGKLQSAIGGTPFSE